MDIGCLNINFLGHSGFLFEYKNSGNGKRIAIDPYNVSDILEKVDIILISHSHYDHCSIKDIEKLAKKGTVVIATPDCQSKLTRIDGIEMHVFEPSDKIEIGNVRIESIRAYNTDKDYHPKKEGWLGYIIKVKDTIVYFAGDTDKIKEMDNLTGYGKHGNTFVALLPVSGTYVMDYQEAAEVALLLKPTIVVPMHYGAGVAGSLDDANKFVELCKENGVNAKVLEKI